MTNIGSINNTAAKPDAGDTDVKFQTKEEHASLDRDDFMKLFVTQLQYQDPMNPMKSAEMASQVAQFNMVDLMYKNNSALENMTKAENMAASVNAIGLLGHRVEYAGSMAFVTEDGLQPFHIKNESDTQATSVQASIYNQKGALIRKLDLGPMDPGQDIKLDWDATDASGQEVQPGSYKVSIDAVDASGQELDLRTTTMGLVSGIETGPDGFPKISIKGDKPIDFKEITKVES